MAAPSAERKSCYSESLKEQIHASKVFVVGAGGIGCELLKNLVLVGYKNISLIDLDTIDVSNLNRQFLFRKKHVQKSKAKVARESVLAYGKDVEITAYHDSIFSSDYGVSFFKQFNIVLNALDNRAARTHVNRMCLAARVPLIEAGTAGYFGQVQVIQRGLTECYECQPQPAQKSYPGCTIRNTPSEPVHCIVWAKHLFNQLFGEPDPDQDVSPDTEDPELAGEAGKSALIGEAKADVTGGIERTSTRTWAEETGYNAAKLFNKLFRDDVHYLLSMENLWKKRQPPVPLDFDHQSIQGADSENGSNGDGGISDQRVWSLDECKQVFSDSLADLRQLKEEKTDNTLVWDKDETAAMDFVASAANLRMHIFHIGSKSRFDIKSMAGNIIPAIATTNAIIAAVQVMESLKIVSGRIDRCKATYLVRKPNTQKKLLNPCQLEKPNSKCYVCSEKPEVTLQVNPATMTLQVLRDKVLKRELGMQSPDVELDDGKGTILLTDEEGVTDGNETKFLSEFSISEGSRLKCDDFLQEYNLIVIIDAIEELEGGDTYRLIVDRSKLQAKPEQSNANGSKSESDEDDLMEIVANVSARKRVAEKGSGDDEVNTKKPRLDTGIL
ncbi:SUMO-activating enzyme subunit 2-like [Watersipora subatra]|uniref:SUMO-activating enzyme subunit 2-like n=1 Tax=Watersipora subatra TaxID=2589382 RepID=UPI00355B0DB5